MNVARVFIPKLAGADNEYIFKKYLWARHWRIGWVWEGWLLIKKANKTRNMLVRWPGKLYTTCLPSNQPPLVNTWVRMKHVCSTIPPASILQTSYNRRCWASASPNSPLWDRVSHELQWKFHELLLFNEILHPLLFFFFVAEFLWQTY